MRRKRHSPLTASGVRQLASRRGYLLTREAPRAYKLFDLSGRRAYPVKSKDGTRGYTWRLTDVDAWLRKQPLLREL